MIDISTENLIAIRDAPKHLPLRNGKKVHVSAVYRWASRGLRGTVLESIKVGGTTYTSTEALQRFAERLTMGKAYADSPIRPSRRKAVEDAKKYLSAELGESGSEAAVRSPRRHK